jgi:hypothetical protein
MPVVLALALLGLGALVAGLGARAPRLGEVGWREAPRALVTLAGGAFAALALERLGYRSTMLALLFFLTRVVERRGAWGALAFSLGMAWGSFYLFHSLLRVPLPRGPWGL